MLEPIKKYLSDPGWWFTAVFVGLLLNVFGAFAKDWVSRALAYSFEAWKVKRSGQFEKMLAEAEEIARDEPNAVVLAYLWLAMDLLRVILSLTVSTGFFLSFMVLYLSKTEPDHRLTSYLFVFGATLTSLVLASFLRSFIRQGRMARLVRDAAKRLRGELKVS